MPTLVPPPCELNIDLDPAAVPRYVSRLRPDGLGLIISCDPPFWCRPWPSDLPIPPRWVEATTDELTLQTADPLLCDIATLDRAPVDYIDVASGLVSPRDARAPRVPRARRAPRPPRPPRRRRAPRTPRAPRAPRPPRPPREPRTQRPVLVLFRGWNGWPQAGKRLAKQDERSGFDLPRGDRWCVVDYTENIPQWEEIILGIADDEKTQEYLSQRFGYSGVCAGDGASACEAFAAHLASLIDTADQMVQGKRRPADLGRPRGRQLRPRPRPAPSTTAPTRFGTQDTTQLPVAGAYVYQFFGPTNLSQCPAPIPPGTVLRLTFPRQPTDVGCNNQWVGLGPLYTGPFYDADP